MNETRRRRLVIKENELLMYTDDEGLIPAADDSPLGLYFRDTRFLSRLEMTVGGRPPVLLSSTAERDYLSSAEFTNLEIRGADGETIPQTSVHVRRTRLISDRIYELLRIKNYHSAPVEVVVELTFDADFRDMFEVRGTRRHKRGTRLAPKSDGDTHDARLLRPRRGAAQDDRALRTGAGAPPGRHGELPGEPRAARAQGGALLDRGGAARRPAAARAATSPPASPTCAAITSAGSPARPTSSPTPSRSRACCVAARPTCACWRSTRPTGAPSRPPCPGSWRPSAATRSSPASRP